MNRIALPLILLALSGCAGTTSTQTKTADDTAPLVLKESSFDALPNWQGDDLDGFMQAYRTSCTRILKKDPQTAFSDNPAFGVYGDWQAACREGERVNAQDAASVRAFLSKHFKVVQATAAGIPKDCSRDITNPP